MTRNTHSDDPQEISNANSHPEEMHLDGVQGADEQRSETYEENMSNEQSQSATKQSAKSGSRVTSSASEQATAVHDSQNENIEEAILYGKKYLEDILSFFGLNIDIYATTEDKEVIELDIPSTHLNGFLIGHNGETMRALQYTISTALKNQNFAHARVNIDIAGYKKQKADRLTAQAQDWFAEVRESGKSRALSPMNAADRRTIHKAAEEYGLETESVGEGRERHIVLKPTNEKQEPDNKT